DERVELALELPEERLEVDGRDVHRLASGLETPQIERRVHEPEEVERALPDAPERVLLIGGERTEGAFGEEIRVARDDVERGAQLVRHRRDELGLQSARRLQVADEPRVLERHRGRVRDPEREPALLGRERGTMIA